MTTISEDNKIEFYKFLEGDIPVSEFESFVYSQTGLEQQLNSKIYLELISLNYKDKYEQAKLAGFIKDHIIHEVQYETWKLKTVLTKFLGDHGKIHIYLDKLYHLYCGMLQDNGQRKYEFKFLANLGLNYLYWVDEGYLKTNYGDRWEEEYQKCFTDFEFYHQQLRPFAAEILTAINNSDIQILNDGTYKIKEDLKRRLEADKIFKLKHRDYKSLDNS